MKHQAKSLHSSKGQQDEHSDTKSGKSGDERKLNKYGRIKSFDKKTGEKTGKLEKTMDILLYVALIWLISIVIREKFQVSGPIKNNPEKNNTENSKVQHRSSVKRHVPIKPATLPNPPPSPRDPNTGKESKTTHYDHYEKYIFVGGIPGAGSSLMRAILDAHPDVRCNDVKDVLGKLMQTWRSVGYNKNMLDRMKLAGVQENVIDISMIMFLIELIANSGPAAPRLCVRDPMSMFGGRYLLHVLSNMKMVFLVRDLRAAAYSIKRRKKAFLAMGPATMEKALVGVDKIAHTMRQECSMMGVDRCIPVRYENLVMNPRETIEEVLHFLDLPWREEVLHHYYYANKTGVFSLPDSNDTDPIYDSSLTSWVGSIPSYLSDFHSHYYRQLQFMGYDPESSPPDYSRLPSYNWTKPENPVPIFLKDTYAFRRIIAKVVATKLKHTLK